MELPNSVPEEFLAQRSLQRLLWFFTKVPSNFVINRVASGAINNLMIKVRASIVD
jgi:hypothetical protein